MLEGSMKFDFRNPYGQISTKTVASLEAQIPWKYIRTYPSGKPWGMVIETMPPTTLPVV